MDIAVAERAAGVGPVTMHGYSKTDFGGSNRGAKASPANRWRVYPRLSGAATECDHARGPKNDGKSRKVTEKQRCLAAAHPSTDCLIPAHAYLDAHDGAFPLPKYLCGGATGLLRQSR